MNEQPHALSQALLRSTTCDPRATATSCYSYAWYNHPRCHALPGSTQPVSPIYTDLPGHQPPGPSSEAPVYVTNSTIRLALLATRPPPYRVPKESMSTSDSYVISDMAASESHDEDLDSLPSISSDLLSSEASESPSDAQKEWEESLEQIQLLLTMVVVPFAGKYLGRKFAYWSTLAPAPRVFPCSPHGG